MPIKWTSFFYSAGPSWLWSNSSDSRCASDQNVGFCCLLAEPTSLSQLCQVLSQSRPAVSQFCQKLSQSRPALSQLCQELSQSGSTLSQLCQDFSQRRPAVSLLCQEFSQSMPALGPALSRIAQNRAFLGAHLSRVATYFYSGANSSSDLLWNLGTGYEFTVFCFNCRDQ